jgi:hypothetical protein
MVKWSPIWSKMTLDEVWEMEQNIKTELDQHELDT